jgi:hypothetical protein
VKRSTRCSSPKSGYRPQPRRAGSRTSSVRYSRLPAVIEKAKQTRGGPEKSALNAIDQALVFMLFRL